MTVKMALFKAALVVQLAAVPFLAGAAVSSQFVVTTADYSAISSEKQTVTLWLQQHAQRVNGHLIGDFNQIGDITVTYSRETATDGRVTAQSPGDAPPTPLPSNGRPGDTYSVSSCSKGLSQTWTYTFVNNSNGGSWQLVSYTYNQKACGSSGA